VFGQRVKTLREQRGLTQQQLATMAGLTNDTISNYERGRRTDPPVSVVYAVASALEVTVEELLAEPQAEQEVAATP
jgi:transcriptional regulator with XRE-family HTH domain